MCNNLQDKKIVLIVFTFLYFMQLSAGKARLTTESIVTSREKRQSTNGTGCLLPSHPHNGMYSLSNGATYIKNAYVQIFTFIDLECNKGFQPSKINNFVCTRTSWAPEISNGTCIRTCPSLPSSDTYDTRCYRTEVEVSCENALDGTSARAICKPSYTYGGRRADSVCTNGFWDSHPTPCEQGCLLPDHPQNGTYTFGDDRTYFENTYTETSSLISLKCNEGFQTSEIHNFFCTGSSWQPEISKGTCMRTCPTVPSTDTYTIRCFLRGLAVSCENPLDGTLARTICKPFYIYRGTRITPVCTNGAWDPRPIPCEPECGRKIINTQGLIIGGSDAKQGEYPWMIAIYNISSNPQKHICGGTIISRFYVLSAAHCFANSKGVPYPKEYFSIVAGKYYRELNIEEDGVQSREIKRLIIYEDYRGRLTKYRDDIALIEIEKFDLSLTVQLVCIDWDNSYEEQDFRENNTAVVAGWGFTKEVFTQAEVLKKLIVSYSLENVCKNNIDPDFFLQYYASDKICAGFKDNGTSVCSGDSGGGLYFQSFPTSFFIRGILSLTQRSDTSCATNHYALYTKVSKYLQWIEAITQRRV